MEKMWLGEGGVPEKSVEDFVQDKGMEPNTRHKSRKPPSAVPLGRKGMVPERGKNEKRKRTKKGENCFLD